MSVPVSRSSNSISEVPLPPDFQRQKPGSTARPSQSKRIHRNRIVLAILVIFVLACANLAFRPESPPWASNHAKRNIDLTNTSDSIAFASFNAIADMPDSRPIPPASSVKLVESASQPAIAPAPSVLDPQPETEEGKVTEPVTPKTEHVVIISVDGLRPDALLLADTPNLDKLIKKGSYCPHAQTISLSITLPSHASMLSGMLPAKHGIQFGLPYIGWPGMNGPTIFSVAHNAGLSTGMVFGKQKLGYIALENSVDKLFSADAHDPEVKTHAIEVIEEGLPNVLFIHFPDTDRVGHAYGWMSENQLYSVNFVDGLIGEVVDTLDREGYLETTLLIITADHGGHGFGHGDDAQEDRTIPWLAVGPEVNTNAKITQQINTYDTAATAAHALNLPIPEYWDGKPVLEIFK